MSYKHDYDKILTRLVTILSRLNNGEALSIKELADEFNVSTRTIQRDLNERLISFPIYYEGKKWRMKKGFRLEKSTSIEDVLILEILEGFIESNRGKFSTKAKNLLSKLKNQEINPIYTKLNMEDFSEKLTDFQLLDIAIKNRQMIFCNYTFEGLKKSLKLKPLKIANYEGFWYLLAIDTKCEKLKKYYLKNISDIKISSESFEYDRSLDIKLENALSIWFDESAEPFEVRLFVSAKVAKYFKRKPISKSQKIEAIHEDGSLEISVMITHKMEIIPLVKYWIPHVKLISPSNIQEEIEEDLQLYLKEEAI